MDGVQVNTHGGAATNAINEVLKDTNKKPRKKREGRKLTWNERQYGAGFIFGLEVGLLTGLPVAFVIYQVAKVVVHFIEGV